MAGRSSDTRERVRAIADRLVEEGGAASTITVDRIYAELQQGSRTTINDELKTWRRERAVIDAQTGRLPQSVLNAANALWGAASQAAEAALQERRQAIENEAQTLQERLQGLERDLAREREGVTVLRAQGVAQNETIEALRQELTQVRTAADAARTQLDMLAKQIETQRVDSARRLGEQQADAEARIAALTQAQAERDATYRTEIDKAHIRLEGVQNHMLQQVAEAREAAKRAEAAHAKALARGDDLATQWQAAREDLAAIKAIGTERAAHDRQEIDRLTAAVQTLEDQIDKVRRSEAAARERLAAASEQIVVQAEQVKAGERERAALLERLTKSVRRARAPMISER